MRPGGRFLATAALSMCLAGAATARDLTDDEYIVLGPAVEMYGKAMGSKAVPFLLKAIPPRVVTQMADQDQVSEGDIRRGLGELIGIPTETVMATGGERKTLMRRATLAPLDGGFWFLIRGSDAQQVAALREAYPEYEAVAFPDATMELVKELS